MTDTPVTESAQFDRFDLAAYDDVFLVRDRITGLLRRAGRYAEVIQSVAEYNLDPRLAELSQASVQSVWRLMGRDAVRA